MVREPDLLVPFAAGVALYRDRWWFWQARSRLVEGLRWGVPVEVDEAGRITGRAVGEVVVLGGAAGWAQVLLRLESARLSTSSRLVRIFAGDELLRVLPPGSRVEARLRAHSTRGVTLQASAATVQPVAPAELLDELLDGFPFATAVSLDVLRHPYLLPPAGAAPLREPEILAALDALFPGPPPSERWGAVVRLAATAPRELLAVQESIRERWPPTFGQYGRAPWSALCWVYRGLNSSPMTAGVLRDGWSDRASEGTGGLRTAIWRNAEDPALRAIGALAAAEVCRRHAPADPPAAVNTLLELAAEDPDRAELYRRAAVAIGRQTLLRTPKREWEQGAAILARLPEDSLDVRQLWLSAAQDHPELGAEVASHLAERGRADSVLLDALRGSFPTETAVAEVAALADQGDPEAARRASAVVFAAPTLRARALRDLRPVPGHPFLGGAAHAGDWLFATRLEPDALVCDELGAVIASGVWVSWDAHVQNQLWLTVAGRAERSIRWALSLEAALTAELVRLRPHPPAPRDQRRITLLRALAPVAAPGGGFEAELGSLIGELASTGISDDASLVQRLFLTLLVRPIDDVAAWLAGPGRDPLDQSLRSGAPYVVAACLAVAARSAGMPGFASWLARPMSHLGYFREHGTRWARQHAGAVLGAPRSALLALLRDMIARDSGREQRTGTADTAFRFLATYAPDVAWHRAREQAVLEPEVAVRWVAQLPESHARWEAARGLIPFALHVPACWKNLAVILAPPPGSDVESAEVGAAVAAALASQPLALGPLLERAIGEGWVQADDPSLAPRLAAAEVELEGDEPRDGLHNAWSVRRGCLRARWAAEVRGAADWVNRSAQWLAAVAIPEPPRLEPERVRRALWVTALRDDSVAPGATDWAWGLLCRRGADGLGELRELATSGRRGDPVRALLRAWIDVDHGRREDATEFLSGPRSNPALGQRLLEDAELGWADAWTLGAVRSIAVTRRAAERLAHDWQKADLTRIAPRELADAFVWSLRRALGEDGHESLDLGATIEEILSAVVDEHRFDNVRIESWRGNRAAPQRQAVHRGTVERLLVNLIGNAARHRVGGPVVVSLGEGSLAVSNTIGASTVDWLEFAEWLQGRREGPPEGISPRLGTLTFREALRSATSPFTVRAEHDDGDERWLTLSLRWGGG